MKAIFLDLDGVLNTERYIVNAIENDMAVHDKYGHIFDDKCIEVLRNIIKETDAKIIISSTWRYAGLEEMKNLWKDRNLPGEVIDVTLAKDSSRIKEQKRIFKELYGEDFYNRTRGQEIDIYLKTHSEVNKYVIIDDDSDMLEDQNFVQVDAYNGLEEKHIENILKYLI
ncbi:MAG: hypothetical protein J1F35_06215 [Erysipelotrichales bacterium]|nr:hypothetical protein [Erysipelotrichales bacterium]